MALLQRPDASDDARPSMSSLFELQKVYYSNLNISKNEHRKKGKRYQKTVQATPSAVSIRRAAEVASSLDGRRLPRARAAQSMITTLQPPSPSNSQLPRLPSIRARHGFPF